MPYRRARSAGGTAWSPRSVRSRPWLGMGLKSPSGCRKISLENRKRSRNQSRDLPSSRSASNTDEFQRDGWESGYETGTPILILAAQGNCARPGLRLGGDGRSNAQYEQLDHANSDHEDGECYGIIVEPIPPLCMHDTPPCSRFIRSPWHLWGARAYRRMGEGLGAGGTRHPAPAN